MVNENQSHRIHMQRLTHVNPVEISYVIYRKV
jgi:hypothetical protein